MSFECLFTLKIISFRYWLSVTMSPGTLVSGSMSTKITTNCLLWNINWSWLIEVVEGTREICGQLW